MKNGPWIIKERKIINKNPWSEMIVDNVIRPDGKEGEYAFIKVPDGVTILPLDDDGNVYLGREFFYPLETYLINTPTGARNKGEDALTAAKRELLEEQGIEAEEWINLGKYQHFSAMTKCQNTLFLARKLTFKKHHRESVETIESLKMTFEEAIEKVEKGEIIDGESIAVILKTKLYLDKNK